MAANDLTTRDFFAAFALAGRVIAKGKEWDKGSWEYAAREAYQCADAMMLARGTASEIKQPEEPKSVPKPMAKVTPLGKKATPKETAPGVISPEELNPFQPE